MTEQTYRLARRLATTRARRRADRLSADALAAAILAGALAQQLDSDQAGSSNSIRLPLGSST